MWKCKALFRGRDEEFLIRVQLSRETRIVVPAGGALPFYVASLLGNSSGPATVVPQ